MIHTIGFIVFIVMLVLFAFLIIAFVIIEKALLRASLFLWFVTNGMVICMFLTFFCYVFDII